MPRIPTYTRNYVPTAGQPNVEGIRRRTQLKANLYRSKANAWAQGTGFFAQTVKLGKQIFTKDEEEDPWRSVEAERVYQESWTAAMRDIDGGINEYMSNPLDADLDPITGLPTDFDDVFDQARDEYYQRFVDGDFPEKADDYLRLIEDQRRQKGEAFKTQLRGAKLQKWEQDFRITLPEYVKSRDLISAKALIEGATNAGVLSPEQAEKLTTAAETDITYGSAMDTIRANLNNPLFDVNNPDVEKNWAWAHEQVNTLAGDLPENKLAQLHDQIDEIRAEKKKAADARWEKDNWDTNVELAKQEANGELSYDFIVENSSKMTKTEVRTWLDRQKAQAEKTNAGPTAKSSDEDIKAFRGDMAKEIATWEADPPADAAAAETKRTELLQKIEENYDLLSAAQIDSYFREIIGLEMAEGAEPEDLTHYKEYIDAVDIVREPGSAADRLAKVRGLSSLTEQEQEKFQKEIERIDKEREDGTATGTAVETDPKAWSTFLEMWADAVPGGRKEALNYLKTSFGEGSITDTQFKQGITMIEDRWDDSGSPMKSWKDNTAIKIADQLLERAKSVEDRDEAALLYYDYTQAMNDYLEYIEGDPDATFEQRNDFMNDLVLKALGEKAKQRLKNAEEYFKEQYVSPGQPDVPTQEEAEAAAAAAQEEFRPLKPEQTGFTEEPQPTVEPAAEPAEQPAWITESTERIMDKPTGKPDKIATNGDVRIGQFNGEWWIIDEDNQPIEKYAPEGMSE